jgi:polysaccharide deacetylase family protein (PEP-CTERM system associated)
VATTDGDRRGPVNALSVDVEDWYHDESRGSGATSSELAASSPRVERNVMRLLEIFARSETRATFFFLATIARENPRLTREVRQLGHEIACHGLRHLSVSARPRDEVRGDVRDARATIEDIVGAPVLGFRAPCFLRHARDLWVLDVLAEEGFVYDSSWLPLRYRPGPVPTLGGVRGPARLPSGLWEFPLPMTRVVGHVLPVAAGGFVLRALPFTWSGHYLARFNREVGPAVVYTHPWEVDPDSPKLPGTRAYVRFFNGVGRGGMAAKLARLTDTFRFAPLATVYARELSGAAAAVPPTARRHR